MNPRAYSIADSPTRRRIRGFEGGSIYAAEEDGKFFVICDETALLDLLNEADRVGFEPVTVHEFTSAADRRDFLTQRGWTNRMDFEQQTFLDAQIFSMSLMATAQRNRHLYRQNATDDEKKPFRNELRRELQRISAQYRRGISPSQHFANIEGLANHMSAVCPGALEKGRFKIGAAQKALNLYLKYLWCVGRIEAPPHCPFDSIVLSKIGRGSDKWTEEDKIETYKIWVSLAEAKARGTSIAEWELQEFNTQYNEAPRT